VLRLVDQQGLPGRRLVNEWRFLKSAIQQWLSSPPPRFSKEAQSAVIGSWKDDPHIEEELPDASRRRGRPVTGPDQVDFYQHQDLVPVNRDMAIAKRRRCATIGNRQAFRA
jgi:hypothetical protein